MASNSNLKRGFKAKSDRLAKQYREELNIHPCGALCAFKLAKHLKIHVLEATRFLTLPEEIKLLSNDCEWSALTMNNIEGVRIIIHNPYHTTARQQSDLMHELAHIICEHNHPVVTHYEPLPIGMRNYDLQQEEEANWLGSTLLLATPGLLWAKKNGMTVDKIAEHFNASAEMVNYRLNITGINKRYR